ncbi:LacI family DNA-binding transcriptional regulator [Conexibacter sp. JD483]|uniref:LacI family DNA-binding transcriptional regulator n=1 Tax=unclassified Conexibacter TaxID=2627773 RepID=UPI002715732F|nr:MULTISPECIES: LacI family DNA-binding transcriptional regulator [unclassified Conexibacter]MDO8187351.1 LacI family DNA-binding transcriptional regulator [Conexibacter sp. CPCC 205706]MDO8200516.1 LacI family DNA-binding transcriptional regulator [Conexibacter sp. CPCC 205762]MDR9370015.1 LacI family DNA-binding transcriptional regulator [Conexibacter sp. JD483]
MDTNDQGSSAAAPRPTVQDVARALGVSTATVSRALSGSPNVSTATREKVMRGAAQLGYQPNVLARALRQERSSLVGLVVPDVRSDFFAAASSVLQRALEEHGFRLILGITGDDPDADRDYLVTLLQHRAEGIVHVPCTDEGAAPLLGGVPTPPPVVEFLRQSRSNVADTVVSNEREGARQLAEHLIAFGHRRLAVLAGPDRFSTTRDRVGGFVDGADAHGLEVEVRYGLYDHDWTHRETLTLMAGDAETRPTALFAAGNRLVSGALQALSELGLRVPADVSLVGADDPDWFRGCTPSVTTFAAPLEQMGLVAAQTLLGRMRPKGRQPRVGPIHALLGGQLIVRGSSGPPAAGA